MKTKFTIFAAALALIAGPALPGPGAVMHAAVIGANPPARALTADTIATLPAAEQPAWQRYLAQSRALRAKDQAFLADELHRTERKVALVPPKASTGRSLPLDEKPAWYAGAEARRRADNVVTFQTPAGGWSKGFDATDHPRAAGESFSGGNTSRHLAPGDHDQPAELDWNYIGTFDNDATTRHLRFLARVAAASDEPTGAAWRRAFERGLAYIFAAQYPNGGWPQTYPLDGGYHDAVTFNDGAMTNILLLLRDVAAGQREFAFVRAEYRLQAAASESRGLACLLRCQVKVASRLNAWAQQYDMLTLAPTSARNYEMPAISSGESAGILGYLMSLERPSAEVVRAVHAAAAWLEETKLRDVAWGPAENGSGKTLVPAPGAGPLWARYYEIGSNRPLFGDRDKSIHDDVNGISAERRNGYGWYSTGPARALERYAQWARLEQTRGR
jgi:PelA/Pel-15E family pectate lyase